MWDGSAWAVRTVVNLGQTKTSVFAADVDGDEDMDVLSASLGPDHRIARHQAIDSAHNPRTTAHDGPGS